MNNCFSVLLNLAFILLQVDTLLGIPVFSLLGDLSFLGGGQGPEVMAQITVTDRVPSVCCQLVDASAW